MRSRYKRLFGSARSRYFKEAKARRGAPVKRRPQRVRFRRRYASSVLRQAATRLTTILLWLGLISGAGWGGLVLWESWESSRTLNVTAVEFQGDVPEDLRNFLPFRAGQNVLSLRPREWEGKALHKFPELETISIARRWDRRVVVSGRYRRPIARLEWGERVLGVDAGGAVFPWVEGLAQPAHLPALKGDKEQAAAAAAFLLALQRHAPLFFSRIKVLETDRILPARVLLDDGVNIIWGDMNCDRAVAKAKNALTLMEQFEPRRRPATLRFVTDDRLIIDSNWVRRV